MPRVGLAHVDCEWTRKNDVYWGICWTEAEESLMPGESGRQSLKPMWTTTSQLTEHVASPFRCFRVARRAVCQMSPKET